MKTFYRLMIVIFIAVFLTGCWDQNIYEKIGLALNLGIDLSADDKVQITISYPVISERGGGAGGGGESGGSGEIKSETVKVDAYLLRESRESFSKLTPRQIQSGKIQSILISKNFAEEKQISEYFEIFERDTQTTVQARAVIVDGSAGELISKGSQFKGKPILGIYLHDLLKGNNRSGYCPDTSIIDYDIKNTIPGLSPILPIVKLEGDFIKVTGTALIDRDRMTGRLDTEETACMYLAMGKYRQSDILFDLPEEIKSVKKRGIIFTRRVRSKSKIQFKDGVPMVHYTIKLKAILEEYTWGNITDPEYKKKIEESLNGQIKSSLDKVFKKLQDANCDALGIGDKIRAYHNDYWISIGELDGWKEIYPKMEAGFDVETSIVRFGEIK